MKKIIFLGGIFWGTVAFSQAKKTIEVKETPSYRTGVDNYVDAELRVMEEAKKVCPLSAKAGRIDVVGITYNAKFCGRFDLEGTLDLGSIASTRCYPSYITTVTIVCPSDRE